MAKKGNGSLRLYKAYNFRDKDPVIDELRTIVKDTYGELNGKSLKDMQESGGPSVACMRSWFFGTTRRPQNPTIEAAGRSMGFKREWVKMRSK